MPMLRYLVTAALLGIGWLPVLLFPSVTRGWLLEDVPSNVACLMTASVIVAVVFRSFIQRADTFSSHVWRATVVPYAGCAIFLTLWNAMIWIEDLMFGGLANLPDTLSLYAMGFLAASLSFFVVVPYGLLCQYVMHAAGAGVEGRITA